MKKNIIIYLVLMPCLVSLPFNAIGAEDLRDSSIPGIWHAIQSYLEWKNYWFEAFEGKEQCYENLVGKNTQIDFYVTTFSDYSKECRGNAQNKYLTTISYVYIHGTNFLFDVVDLNDKARAVIGILSSGKNCTPGDLVKETLANHSIDAKIMSSHIRLPQVKQLELPPIVENLNNTTVINAIRRSMPNLLVNYETNKERKILVGRFTESDPFIWIYDKENEILYQLIFPSTSILENIRMCLGEYSIYRLNNPTEKSEEDFFNYLKGKIISNSFEVSLKGEPKN